ncbi:MAG TPA: ATP-binding protein [Polyangia bacterium]|nr:ATP-binding protein [Polyangia bacterium]
MPASSSRRLSKQLALASLGTVLAVGVVCAVGLFSLGNASAVARMAVTRQLHLADDAAGMSAFLYQKGFVAEYLLTGDRRWLEDLEGSRPAFESWLAHAHEKVTAADGRRLLEDIQSEYTIFDTVRRRAIALHDAGRLAEARVELETNRAHAQQLRALFERLAHGARLDAEARMAEAERSVRRLAGTLVVTSLCGAGASLLVGFFWARRITKPIYELEVRIESAAERTRIKVEPGRPGLEALGDQVTGLIDKLEQTDAALAEHRRRLIQSEKLSAVGELAAKLAHEVLNPLAGIKAAIQVLARQRDAASPVTEVVEAVDREVSRVDSLLRRLMSFARPLAPKVQVVEIGTILDQALDATRARLQARGVKVERSDEPGLPPLEADPLLLSQALANLLANAADATPAPGGIIEVTVARARVLDRAEIQVRVADHGAGISDDAAAQLFKPFFTTKAEGHGLGLAVSQNIVLEHGGRIAARNRPAEQGPGAIFELSLPIVR